MDPLDSPENFEIRAAQENGEFATPEVGGSTLENGVEEDKQRVEEALNGLYADIFRVANKIEPGLGSAILSRAQEEIGKLRLQLEGSTGVDSSEEYGNFNDGTAPGGQEKFSLGDIEDTVRDLREFLATLPNQVRGQQGEVQTIDLDHLDDSGSRAVGIFNKIMTGEESFKAGNKTEVGDYEITATRGQGTAGAGEETPQIEIRKADAAEEEENRAGSVVAAEDEVEATTQPTDNLRSMEDHRRNMPDTRDQRQAQDSPGEQNRVA
jgi:hypothetical protein